MGEAEDVTKRVVNKGTRSSLGSGPDTETLLVQLKWSLSADGNIFFIFFLIMTLRQASVSGSESF